MRLIRKVRVIWWQVTAESRRDARESKRLFNQSVAHVAKLPRTRKDIQVAYAKPEYLQRINRAAKAEEEKRRKAHVGEGEQ